MKPTAQIFLCYAHHDEEQVAALYHKFKNAGFKPWMDKFNLIGGELWQPTIEKAIKKSDFFIACLSKNSVNRRGFLRREINVALETLKELLESDIYIIPIRLEECEVPESLSLFQWVNLFEREGWDRLLKAVHKGMDRLGIIKPVKLRVTPIDGLSRKGAQQMIREYGFADVELNRFGKGLQHQYKVGKRGGKKVVTDHTTNLMWQQSGSPSSMNYADAEKYIRELNDQKFAGFSEWRLPTLEEAMSLMEPERMENHLYIDPLFDETQHWIWNADKLDASGVAWNVNFYAGSCSTYLVDGYYVRAVRSGQSVI